LDYIQSKDDTFCAHSIIGIAIVDWDGLDMLNV